VGHVQLLLALLIAVSPEVQQQADRLMAQAKANRAAGAFKDALDEAQRAYILVPKPAYLLEIAQDQSGLGKWMEAARVYEHYLATKPKGAARAQAEKALADARAHENEAPPPDPLAIAPLTPVAPAAPEAAAPAAPISDSSRAFEAQLAPPPIVELPATSEEGPKRHSHVLAYSLIGVAAASVVFAVIGWVEVASYNSFVGSLKAGASGQNALSQQSSANSWQDVAITTTIVAGLSGGGVALTW
jgi:hypothetical protein